MILGSFTVISNANGDCTVEGGVDLRVDCAGGRGWVTGWIGQTRFFANCWSSRLDGEVQGLNIRMFLDPISQRDYLLSGWIGSTSVSWTSFGDRVISGYVCLR